MAVPLRVLLVEDSADDAELVLRALRRGGYQPEHRRVDTPEDMERALEEYDWDVVLADYAMPRFSAFDALAMVQERGLDIPFIVISGTIGEEIAVQAMKAGAHDYLMKDNLARLVPAVERELREADERRARRVAEETVWHQAYHDALTGLPNRWLLVDRLTQAIAYARREGARVALLFLDLDRFKLVNETLGHTVGDELLRLVADRLLEGLREGDTLARPGGDEFAVVLAGLEAPERAAEVAEDLVRRLDAPLRVQGRDFHLAATVGVALFPEHGHDPETLLKNAEAAMYAAKQEGGGVRWYERHMDTAVEDRLTLENELRRALRQDELVVYYQPQVSLADGALVGVEALVRWRHPERGLVPPMRFIPLAEETGLICPLGEQVVAKAAADVARLRTDVPRRLAELVRGAGLDPALLEFEITESALMQATDTASEILRGLRGMGARIAIDDFGTGYSSLTYLKRFPVDALKIDQAFTRQVSAQSDDAATRRSRRWSCRRCSSASPAGPRAPPAPEAEAAARGRQPAVCSRRHAVRGGRGPSTAPRLPCVSTDAGAASSRDSLAHPVAAGCRAHKARRRRAAFGPRPAAGPLDSRGSRGSSSSPAARSQVLS